MESLAGRIRNLIQSGAVRVSEHGYDELADDDLTAREVIQGAVSAIEVEKYPDCSNGHDGPAVLVTAYRPDAERWDKTFTRRKP